jgi:4-methylaminobutanoate oxidase (formaldehyde-forming)
MKTGARKAIVIGGGVIGLSTAYHLARRRFGRVLLFDKGPVGDGSSGRAAGIITDLLWSETGVRARRKSLELYRELSSELTGYRFQDVGCLNLFDRESWPAREPLLDMYRRLGAAFEILQLSEIRRRWPDLDPPEGFVGLHDPLGGYSEPDEYIPALARRARELGVEVREGEKVAGFVLGGGRVAGVRTASGEEGADAVIATVYAWTERVLEPLGLRLPVKAFVHQRYVSRPLSPRPRLPAVNANPLDGYVRPATGDRLLAGIETAARPQFDVPSTDFHQSELEAPAELGALLRRNLAPLIPALAATEWEERRVGLLTFSSDGEPILGPIAGVPGLYVALAFHSGGFAYNPVAGMLMAELVDEGRTSLDVSAFSPDRFDPRESELFLRTPMAQRDLARRRH